MNIDNLHGRTIPERVVRRLTLPAIMTPTNPGGCAHGRVDDSIPPLWGSAASVWRRWWDGSGWAMALDE